MHPNQATPQAPPSHYPGGPRPRAIPKPFVPAAPSRASRFPSLRSRGSHRGSFTNDRNGARLVYESKLEADAAHVLLAHRGVVDLIDQPPAVTYMGRDGKRRLYTFDFLAVMADGRRIAIAVKPHERAEAKRLDDQLRLIARQMSRTFAHAVVLLTDRSFSKGRIRDACHVHGARREAAGADDAAIMKLADGVVGSVAVKELVEASGLKGRAFRAIVRRIGDGDLVVADGMPISRWSRVARPASTEVAV